MSTAKNKYLLLKVNSPYEVFQFFEKNLICINNKMKIFMGRKRRVKGSATVDQFGTTNFTFRFSWIKWHGLEFANFMEFKQFLQNNILDQSSLIFEISNLQKNFFFEGSKLDCLNALELEKFNNQISVIIYFGNERFKLK